MRKCPGHAEDQFHAGKKQSETTKSSASLPGAITSIVSRRKRWHAALFWKQCGET